MLNPLMMVIDEAISSNIKSEKFNFILIIGCDDHSQFACKSLDRAEARKIIEDLYKRWEIGIGFYAPEEIPQIQVTRTSLFLIEEYKKAIKTKEEQHALKNLLVHIRDLEQSFMNNLDMIRNRDKND